MTIKPEHRQLLTHAQLEAVTLEELGMGYRAIARHMGIAVTTARDRLERAHARIAAHLDDQEE